MDFTKKITLTSAVTVLIALAAIFIKDNLFKGEINYVFDTEWYDNVAEATKNLQLSFYPRDNTLQLFDPKLQKVFLKRMKIDSIKEDDLYIGNSVVILSRLHKIIGYANEKTRDNIENQRQRTFAMIKPDAVHRIGEIVDLIYSRSLDIIQMRMVQLTRVQSGEFYKEHESRSFYGSLIDYLTSGPVIAMELIGTKGIENWRLILGPTDSNVARQDAPDSLRAKFGKDEQSNAAHGSDSKASADRELEFFFPTSSTNYYNKANAIAQFENSTLCIVKPHAVKTGILGSILTAIAQENFQITGIKMARLSKVQAEEFLEVYRGVINEYPGMVQQLISGPLVAMEIQSDFGEETPTRFREFVGPSNPEVARDLRPNSLRARYGINKIENGVHCSDLPEDGALEVEYFFRILEL